MGKSKASLSYLTSPPKPDADSKLDDLVLSTSIPDLKSHLGASNKLKKDEIDMAQRFKVSEQDKNFTIAERVLEEEQVDKTSSLHSISPLTPDDKKTLSKMSP